MPITVLIVDDNPVCRTVFSAMFDGSTDIKVVGAAASGDDAVRLVGELRPDIVVLDLQMPDMSGMDVLSAVKQRRGDTKVIILSMYSGRSYKDEAISRGADGYVAKDGQSVEISRAVREVASGKRYFPELSAGSALAAGERCGAECFPGPASGSLTAREKEVLRHIAQGLANKEIADGLAISVRTVEAHRSRIMRKLGLKSHAALIHYAATFDHSSAS